MHHRRHTNERPRRRSLACAPKLAVAIALVSVAALGAGCGSSSAPQSGNTNSAPPPTTGTAPGGERYGPQPSPAEAAYESAVGRLCASLGKPARFSPLGEDLEATRREAIGEAAELQRVRTALDHLRVLPSMRGERRAYLSALASELALDQRIAVNAGEGSDVRAALTQHAYNSQRRSGIASELNIQCLYQNNPG